MAGRKYFMVSNAHVARSKFFGQKVMHNEVEIAYHELLSAVIAFIYLAPFSPSSLVRINTDNQNVVSWLNKSRCSKKLGYRLSSVIELMKLKYNLKISVFYIKSNANTSADRLSRGVIPEWLRNRGVKLAVSIDVIDKILLNPIAYWKNALSL